ncbi:MAG TPA: NAD(P)/FAD-dependent oxidoreductase [Burkholderiaceae bacterium]|nr:NAD(P)/FAD-dependent oxidoreductase [Burkholderiaceae bacterium]
MDSGTGAVGKCEVEQVDVLIVGAGLSGICAAYHLQARFPHKRIAILEGRDAIGGTWDLFRYPGVRSDSDMFTLGYSFRHWRSEKAIAGGAAICDYIRGTAKDYGIEEKIRFRHRVTEASWSSPDALWSVTAETGGAEPVRFTCGFLFMCSGYYDYDNGYLPSWPGMADFAGKVVHPQHWPSDLDYANRRVVVIGSGATAVTLVPALAEQAAHVTMLQRSPSYVAARPSSDRIAYWLQKSVPESLAHALVRWKNIFVGAFFFSLARRRPAVAKRALRKGVAMHLGSDYDIGRHFTPSYNPWEQRLCLVPDADLFKAIRSKKASIVTDEIASFSKTGLTLRSGQQLEADLIVTATGLSVRLFGGMKIIVDGVEQDVSQTLSYKGMMFSGIPNLASAFGYTNASWTLKCELTVKYVCRLLKYMDQHALQSCVPSRPGAGLAELPALDFSSGYVLRANKLLPRQGVKAPWKLHQNYFVDYIAMTFSAVDDGVMRFGQRGAQAGDA